MQQLLKILGFYGRFLPSFTRIGWFFRRLFWRDPRYDFHGRTWLVTGASGGIGRAIAEQAARHGARVIAVARSREKLAALVMQPGVEIEVADLALRSATRELVARLQARGEHIDVLVNNVGVMLDDYSETSEGTETSFATNLLNHYTLTQALLRDSLMAEQATIINMSSAGMYNVPLLPAAIRMTPANYNGVLAYGLHKRAQVVLNDWWQETCAAGGRRFLVMHPGWSDTQGVRTSLPRFRKLLRPLLRTEAQGADTAIWLAATRPAEPRSGVIWFDRKPRPVHVYARTRNAPEDIAALIALLEQESRAGSVPVSAV